MLSVSGKKWILKKYNEEETSYIKDNFFLDEIVSKLISIRNINRADIESFLNPLIKNYLPNPKFFFNFNIFKPCFTIALFSPTKGTTSQIVPKDTKSK